MIIHIEHTKSKWDLLHEAGDVGSNEPDSRWLQPMRHGCHRWLRGINSTFISRHLPGKWWEWQSHRSVPWEWKYWLAAPEARPHQGWSCGAGSDQYFPLMFDCGWSSSTSVSRSSEMAFSFRRVGVAESRGASVSMLSSLSSSTIMSESHCWGPSSAMEMSLTLQPSNGGEDGPSWDLLQ